MTTFYENNREKESFRELFVTMYDRKGLDPDAKAVCYIDGLKCTADALLSIKRICSLEVKPENIIEVYRYFRYCPIFFFPCEIGGINQSRYSVFGDRIDYTLYDLKNYYTGMVDECKLKNAFKRKNTEKWLKKMGTFENIVNWYGVKGIFTDSMYNVYDLENNDKTLTGYKESEYYSRQWSECYYNNLKNKIIMYYNRYSISVP